MTRLSFLPQPFVKISQATRIDLDDYAIAGIHNERARVWKINADDTDGGELTFTAGPGKDDSVEIAIDRLGRVRVAVSEAAGSGASGSTSQPDVQYIADAFPPYYATGGEVYEAAPGGYVRALGVTRNDPPFSGTHEIALPGTIPPIATGLQLRVMSAGASVGNALYVGSSSGTAAAIAVYAIVAGARSTVEGRRAPSPNHTIFASAPSDMVEVYIDIMGWWY